MKCRIDGLVEIERAILRYYMTEGQASLDEASKYAGGSPTSRSKSTKTKTLREAGLVSKIEPGEYDYTLRDHAEGALQNHFEADELEVVVREINEIFSVPLFE